MHMVESVREISELFKTLGETNRLRVVMMLRARPMCVCELACVLGLDQSTVSRHLTKLKGAGLVEDERSGQWTDFKLVLPARNSWKGKILKTLMDELEASDIIRADAVDAKKVDRNVVCKQT